jgi:D-beta-D-heptose 7-phosphate kinase / D-beta-D-heptose 1-phosphate adenosyltransferase
MTRDNSDLTADLDLFASARVLVVGDAMLDHFVYGSVERISPEGPIPVLKVESEERVLGGACNVVHNLAAVHAKPSLVSVVGDDPPGREIRSLLSALALGKTCLLSQQDRATTVKRRYIAGGQQLLRADQETSSPIDDSCARELLEATEAILPGVRALVLSDYRKGVLKPDVVRALIEQAQSAGCHVVVDPKQQDYSVYRGASIITPNRKELQLATGLETETESDVALACRHVIEKSGIDTVLATLGERGMFLATATGTAEHFQAEAHEVYDVTGAGDTVVAMVAAGLAGGVDLERAARIANVAAGIVVSKSGTAVAETHEILHTLHSQRLHLPESKVVDLTSLVRQVRQWRSASLRIGFANGCFDLLHPGHISLLEQARKACDRLIVGLNSDASVARLKGKDHPVQNEAARAVVLAALAAVDRVVVFAEDDPLRLIEAIRPDVLVKGADYRRNQVVGGDLVESYGGRVLLAELLPGHSTSKTIRRFKST